MSASLSITDARVRRFPAALVALVGSAFIASLILGLVTIQPDGSVFNPGPFVTFGLPVAKAAVDISAAVTIGSLLVAAFCVPVGSRAWNRLLDVSPWWAACWMLSSCVAAIMTSLSLTGPVALDALGPSLAQFFTQISVGQAWLATILMTATLGIVAFVARERTGIAAAVCLALATLVPLALQGHASGAGNHVTATIALWLHIVGAAIWVGGLVATVYGAVVDERSFVPLVSRYSALALVGFLAVFISGTAGALVRLNDPVQLASTGYGRLLALKMILLIVLAGFGWAQRTWVLRRFGSREFSAAGRRLVFAWLAGWELVVMGVAMGAGTTLSRTETPGGQILLTTKAEQLTGDLLPPLPALGRVVDTWVFDSAAVFLVITGLGGYLWGVARVRKGGSWPLGRTLSAVAAGIVIMLAACSVPGAYATFSFAAYVAMLLLGGMIGAVLVVAARPIGLLEAAVPRREDGSLGLREWVRWMGASGPGRMMRDAPWLAGLMLVVLLGGAFLTPWLGWAVQDPVGRTVTTLLVFTASVIFTASVTSAAVAERRQIVQAVGVALAVVLAAGLVAVLIALAPGGMFPGWYGVTLPALGVDPAVDQLAGAALIWGASAFTVCAILLLLGRRVTKRSGAVARDER